MDSGSFSTSHTISPELLKKVAAGDQTAFSQMYDQSSSVLFSLTLRILGDKDEAAELLQEVYMEIWRHANRFNEGRGSPLAWMVILTRSRAIDRLRSRQWKSRGSTDSIDESTPEVAFTSGNDPLEFSAQRELRKHVEGAMGELPEEQRQSLELAFYGGLSHREIADQLHEPVGTIKTRIRLAMKKLKSTLQTRQL